MIQGILEDGSIITAQLTGVADGAMYWPASKLDTIFLSNLPFIIDVVHLNDFIFGVQKTLDFEDTL
jgi:hypothetical protein